MCVLACVRGGKGYVGREWIRGQVQAVGRMLNSQSCTHQAPRLCSTLTGKRPNPKPAAIAAAWICVAVYLLSVVDSFHLQGIKEHPWYIKELPPFLQSALHSMAQEQVGFHALRGRGFMLPGAGVVCSPGARVLCSQGSGLRPLRLTSYVVHTSTSCLRVVLQPIYSLHPPIAYTLKPTGYTL